MKYLTQKITFTISAMFCSIIAGYAQAPEQDCINAINVCSDSFSQSSAFSGFGGVDEIPDGSSCMQNGEVNSVWYSFTVFNGGELTMQLNPLNSNDDYDFAIYSLSNDSCAGILSGLNLPVRCNYSSQPGSTGLSNGATMTSAGTSDPNQCSPMQVSNGENYVMVVSNFTSSQTGYQIDFGGSASVVDQDEPVMDNVDLDGECNPDKIFIHMNEQIDCSSIASNGSDFILTGPGGETIISANSAPCSPEGYATRIRLVLSGPLSAVGSYTITSALGSDGNTILDRCGNSLTAGNTLNFNVQALGPELSAAGSTDSDCGQANGTASVSLTGGTGPFSYSWNTSPEQLGPDAVALPPGFWVCTVTDDNGCTDSEMIVVYGINEPVITTVSETPVTCNGINDGAAEINVVGSGPFTYQWNGYPGITGPVANGLSGGSIVIVVTDGNGCQVAHSVNIPVPPALSVPVVTENPNCNQADGSMIVQVSGGTSPYTFDWDHDSGLNNDSAMGLPAGIYNVTITDQNGCFATTQALLVDNFAPNATIGASTPDCGQNSGSAMVLPTNGTPPYSYVWNDPSAQTSQTATGLVGGDYFVTITDGAGCIQIISVKIDTVPEPEATVDFTDATCGLNDGTADISVTGGVAPYSYNWSLHPTYSTSSANDLWPDSYVVDITDSIGCTTAVSFVIDQELPTSEITMNSTADCLDQVFEFSNTTTAMPTSFLWDFGDGNYSDQPTTTHLYSQPGNYTVQLQLLGGCMDDVVQQTVEVFPLPEPSYIVLPDIVTTRVDANFTYTGTDGISYQWDLGNGNGSTLINPSEEYGVEGVYPITLTVTDANGCVTTIEDELKVELAPALFFPNAFLPNGSSRENRTYRIGGIGLTSIEFIITDRWGTEIYHTNSPDQIMYEGWDGSIQGNAAPQGVYPYFVKATFFEGSEFEDSGTITLIR